MAEVTSLPVFGKVSLPPRLPKVPVTLLLESRGSVRRCWLLIVLFLALMMLVSDGYVPKDLGPSKSSCIPGDDPTGEELKTLIFRFGSGSNNGELVMGILSAESCKAYIWPRYIPALAVRSGCIDGCNKWELSAMKNSKTGQNCDNFQC